MASSGPLQCPFCHFSDEESYVLMLHVETLHSEGQSPFEVREGPGEAIQLGGLPPEVDASEDYIECPEAECGESLLVSELELHADMHLAEKLTVEERDDEEDRGGAGGTITVHNQINREDGTLVRVTSISNETPDLIPVLAQLLEQDPSVEYAYLCHPGLRHISKMSREGGFCGYRNIQMLISYMREVRGYECFDEKIPNILRLQDMIEEAWDRGFNSSGRVETGGIRGTRKYIGTPEVCICSYQGPKADRSRPRHCS
ncbi:MAG: hypothetical protein M1832_005781 [Thelocarpon impressellum]|nr:MAG: hypothetical protein M1832_005781 [Thelocarpon impressellum]